MQVIYIAAGTVVLAMTALDAVWTTISGHGAGPLTSRLSRGMWAFALKWHRKRPSHKLLGWAGPAILSLSVLTWIILLWTGWLLVFLADADSVKASPGGNPADFWDKAYFVGFSAFTLGVGDFAPNGATWQVLTVCTTISGFLLVTLAITYSLPVLSACTQQRQLAGLISGLGSDPAAAWDGRQFSGIEQHLAQMRPLIELHAQRHLSYPILHYFHSLNQASAVAPQVAVLYDTMLLLSAAEDRARLPRQTLQPIMAAIEDLLNILEANFITTDPKTPAPPDVKDSAEHGMPVDAAKLAQCVKDRQRYRSLLRSYVRDSGWEWPLN